MANAAELGVDRVDAVSPQSVGKRGRSGIDPEIAKESPEAVAKRNRRAQMRAEQEAKVAQEEAERKAVREETQRELDRIDAKRPSRPYRFEFE
jgi:hypothetical protein